MKAVSWGSLSGEPYKLHHSITDTSCHSSGEYLFWISFDRCHMKMTFYKNVALKYGQMLMSFRMIRTELLPCNCNVPIYVGDFHQNFSYRAKYDNMKNSAMPKVWYWNDGRGEKGKRWEKICHLILSARDFFHKFCPTTYDSEWKL